MVFLEALAMVCSLLTHSQERDYGPDWIECGWVLCRVCGKLPVRLSGAGRENRNCDSAQAVGAWQRDSGSLPSAEIGLQPILNQRAADLETGADSQGSSFISFLFSFGKVCVHFVFISCLILCELPWNIP